MIRRLLRLFEEPATPEPSPGPSPAQLEVLRAAIDFRISEAEQIWGRFDIFVVANSIVLGMLGNALSTSSRSDAQSLGVVVGSVFGEVLVWLWWRMTVRGWEYLEFWQDQIGKLTPDGLPAVLAPVDARRLDTRRGGLRTNSLQVISLRVIALFGLGYLVAGVIGAMTLVVR